MTVPAEAVIRAALIEAQTSLTALLANQATLAAIAEAGTLMAATFKKGGRVFSCGNGGSMCDAMHFAEELTGRYRLNRAPLAAVAIADAGYMSCVSNDFGYEHIFSRYLEAHARAGDVLVAISTSGKSKNILLAVETAKKIGVKVVGMMGSPDSLLGAASDIRIATPGGSYADRVQEMHIKAIHIMIELIERELFPENYKS